MYNLLAVSEASIELEARLFLLLLFLRLLALRLLSSARQWRLSVSDAYCGPSDRQSVSQSTGPGVERLANTKYITHTRFTF